MIDTKNPKKGTKVPFLREKIFYRLLTSFIIGGRIY